MLGLEGCIASIDFYWIRPIMIGVSALLLFLGKETVSVLGVTRRRSKAIALEAPMIGRIQ